MIMTDPPYNVAIGDKNALLNKLQGSKSIEDNLENDKMDDEDFREFMTKASEAMAEAVKEGGAYYCWAPRLDKQIIFTDTLQEAGLIMHAKLIWVKNSLVLTQQDYQHRYEPCIYGWKEGA